MPSTIKDVAAHASVSIATVSRTINAPHRVNAETLARVRESIQALDFTPSALGRQLRGERTRLIGVIVPTLANPVFAESLQGADEAASADGYRLMLMTTEYDTARERAAIETLREQRVDGLIATVADAGANTLLDELDRAELPYVLTHNDTPHRPSVCVDNRRAAREGVHALLARGHRNVTMVAGSFAASDRARLRYQGYADAMQEAGLQSLPAVEIDFNADDVPDSLLASLVRRGDRPTALFCSNDRLAMVVMHALRRAGIDVPRDMSVLGFDGIPLGELMQPALASIATPNRLIGRTAWRQLAPLLGLAGDAHAPQCTTLPHRFRPGATIAEPVSAQRLHSLSPETPHEHP